MNKSSEEKQKYLYTLSTKAKFELRQLPKTSIDGNGVLETAETTTGVVTVAVVEEEITPVEEDEEEEEDEQDDEKREDSGGVEG